MNELDQRYNTDQWPEVTLALKSAGNAPKPHGPGVLRFYAVMTLSVLLPRRGWTLVKKNKNYAYLKPPPEVIAPFRLTARVPTKEQALAIAESCYAEGRSWIGQLGEWPAWYIHQQVTTSHEMSRDPDSGEIIKINPHSFPAKSYLKIGEFGVWDMTVNKIDDGFAVHEHGVFEERRPALKLIEGEAVMVLQSRYERNPEARRLCIAHYGCRCQACGFDFAATYGYIGEGFIHVHHLNPIAEQDGAYEVDPVHHLIPLCANCHAMAHRREPPFIIDELKQMLNR